MSKFLAFFFLIYGLLHVYAFFKARSAFKFKIKKAVPLIAFMAVMIFSPFIIYSSERHGFEFIARVMSYIGYLWMGALFLFVSASVVFELCRSIGFIVKRNLSTAFTSPKISFFVPLLLSITISAYGYFDAKDIRVEHVTFKTAKLPANISSLKIAQISDVHIGLIIREERLKRILGKVKAANPDILVSTGDLVDGQINRLEGLEKLLNEVNPRYGKFAITGNHEYYAGLKQALDFTTKGGFKILRGETVNAAGINIAGVDDPAGEAFGLYKNISEKELLSGLDHGKFTLLLKHRPFADKDSAGLFDLQLSGHTHKGQIFPFSLLTKFYYPSDSGLSNPLANSYLYVSRGTGTWGPPVRFLSHPEVTLIELERE
ncbi:MAG: metallophosphoesterase [Nitrospirae bacterium]|nr:metallophosphoesterase [Nitrospirota bacterium]